MPMLRSFPAPTIRRLVQHLQAAAKPALNSASCCTTAEYIRSTRFKRLKVGFNLLRLQRFQPCCFKAAMGSSPILLWCLRLTVLLFLSELHSVLAAGSSAKSNVDLLTDDFYLTGNGSKYLFWQELWADNAAGAVDLIKNSSAPAVAAGTSIRKRFHCLM